MSGKGLLIGGLAVAMMTTVVPAPRLSTHNPKVLYGAAIFKAIVGDAGSALRLLQRSRDESAPAPRARIASSCPAQPVRG
jgi:hypothetical protein